MSLHPLFVQMLRDFQVEAWIVDKDDGIGLPLRNVLLAECEVAEDGGQVHQHGDEAHVGEFLIVSHARATDFRHEVAAEEAELRFGIFFLECPHQM